MCEGPATAQSRVIMGKADENRQYRRRPAPIRAHPAFPTLVALWFAALLGIGSLLFPAHPLMRLAGLAGASPMIVLAARIAIAVVAGLLGCGLGLLIARKLARGGSRTMREEPDARHHPTMRDIEAEGPRQPILAHEELGDEGLGPVWEDGPAEDRITEEFPAPPRYDSPWLADEDGHIWSEELAEAPLALSASDVLTESDVLAEGEMPAENRASPEGTLPVMADAVPQRPLAELGMVELVERLALAVQNKQGLARSLPANAGDMVRRLDAEVQASTAAYASLADIATMAPAAAKMPHLPPSESMVTFPDASLRRSHMPEQAAPAVGEPDREADALRSALETLRRMSGTA